MSGWPSPKARARARARQAAKAAERGRAEWKTPPPNGPCAGCGKRGARIRHHVVREQDVRREGGDPWDLDNAMLLGRWCECHARHHEGSGRRKLPRRLIPPAAVYFAERLLGPERRDDYFNTHYAA